MRSAKAVTIVFLSHKGERHEYRNQNRKQESPLEQGQAGWPKAAVCEVLHRELGGPSGESS